MQRVALVTDHIDDGYAGSRVYWQGLVGELLRLNRQRDYTLVHRRPAPFYSGKRELILDRPGGRIARKLLAMPILLDRRGFDIVHDTYDFPPFLLPSSFHKVLTVFDATPLLLKTHTLKTRLSQRLLLGRFVRAADHIITLSENSKADIMRIFGLPEDRITVTYLAAGDHFRPDIPADTIQRIQRTHQLPSTFFVSVGTLEPRKNLVRLVEAFRPVAARHPDCALVLVGSRGWGRGPLLETVRRLGLEGRVQFLDGVGDDDLPGIYRAALALVYPSLYEGFGLPPLEAMQCGCPVITSDVSSLPEVVGDAALLVDPYRVDRIEAAMEELLLDRAKRERLTEKGLDRARRFTWERCAAETISVYDQVAGRGAPSTPELLTHSR